VSELVLGPLLRYTGATDATVWVEVSQACEVEVCGTRAASFEVCGHHYALVLVDGLTPGETRPYEVHLDGTRVWPPQEDWPYPASVIRPVADDQEIHVAFGSCRVAVPHEEPYTLSADEDERGREHDALHALCRRMQRQAPEDWPSLLVLLGDQVYADEVDPDTRGFIEARRDTAVPPGVQLADFEEYCHAYRVAWGDPHVRWLLSTVPTAMIFDDHDVHDDWNTSAGWVARKRGQSWWDERIIGAFMSYWLYQHIGNLAPAALDDDPHFCEVRDAQENAGGMLRRFAFDADRDVAGARWSYHRDLGRTRLIVMDSRAGRVLAPGHRAMVDSAEWRYIEDASAGDFEHVLYATSLPVFLGHGMHHLEAFTEALGDGAWGRWVAKHVGERLREGLDLEHWAAFRTSFSMVETLLERVAAGREGAPPASVTVLSGDVHHAYLSRVRFPIESRGQAPVHQAVCSPLRNPLNKRERRAIRAAMSRPAAALGRALTRAVGVPPPRSRWGLVGGGPWFDNQVARIDIDGRRARMRIEKAVGTSAGPELERVFDHALSRG
jgi:hypothetical protein